MPPKSALTVMAKHGSYFPLEFSLEEYFATNVKFRKRISDQSEKKITIIF